MAKTEKKPGSIKDIKVKDKRPIWERFIKEFWNYKEHILIGAVVVILIVMFVFIIIRMVQNPEESPSPTPSGLVKDSGDLGKLVVQTEPAGVLVQFRKETCRTPVTFENVPEGEYIIILSMPGYKTLEKEVKIKRKETIQVNIKMEK